MILKLLRLLGYELVVLLVGWSLVTALVVHYHRVKAPEIADEFNRANTDDQSREVGGVMSTAAGAIGLAAGSDAGLDFSDLGISQHDQWESVRDRLEIDADALVANGGEAKAAAVETYVSVYEALIELTFHLESSSSYGGDSLALFAAPESHKKLSRHWQKLAGEGLKLSLVDPQSEEATTLLRIVCSPGFDEQLGEELRAVGLEHLVSSTALCASGPVLVPAAQGMIRERMKAVPWAYIGEGCAEEDSGVTYCTGMLSQLEGDTAGKLMNALARAIFKFEGAGVSEQSIAAAKEETGVAVISSYLGDGKFWLQIGLTVAMIIAVMICAILTANYLVFAHLRGMRLRARHAAGASVRQIGSMWLIPALLTVPPFVLGTLLSKLVGKDPASMSEWMRELLVLVASIIANLAAFDFANTFIADIQKESTKPYVAFLPTMGITGTEQPGIRGALPSIRAFFGYTGVLFRTLIGLGGGRGVSGKQSWPIDFFLLRGIQDKALEYARKRVAYVLDGFIVLQLLFEAKLGLYSQISATFSQVANAEGLMSAEQFTSVATAIARFLVGILICVVAVRMVGSLARVRLARR